MKNTPSPALPSEEESKPRTGTRRQLLALFFALPLALGGFHLTTTHVGIHGDAVASASGFFGKGMLAGVGDLALGTGLSLIHI